MRLSDAIRLGSMLKPQAFDVYLRHPTDLDVLGDVIGLRRTPMQSCALGAALDALGHLSRFTGPNEDELMLYWPFLFRSHDGPIPCGCAGGCNLKEWVAHLNDYHKWTREGIADWVETVEATQATERPTTADACCSSPSVTLSVLTRA